MTHLKEKNYQLGNLLRERINKIKATVSCDSVELFTQLCGEHVEFIPACDSYDDDINLHIIVIHDPETEKWKNELIILQDKALDRPILAVSYMICTAFVLELLREGVSGYIRIDQLETTLPKAIASIITTGCYLGSEYHPALIQLTRHEKENPYKQLFTDREFNVLQLMLQGKNVRTIAHELFLSESTINDHILQIYRIMGVHSKLEAVKKAYQLGLGDRHHPK